MAEVSSNAIGGNCVHVGTENEKFTVLCSRSPKNLEICSFHVAVWPSTAKKCKIYDASTGPLFFSLSPNVL